MRPFASRALRNGTELRSTIRSGRAGKGVGRLDINVRVWAPCEAPQTRRSAPYVAASGALRWDPELESLLLDYRIESTSFYDDVTDAAPVASTQPAKLGPPAQTKSLGARRLRSRRNRSRTPTCSTVLAYPSCPICLAALVVPGFLAAQERRAIRDALVHLARLAGTPHDAGSNQVPNRLRSNQHVDPYARSTERRHRQTRPSCSLGS